MLRGVTIHSYNHEALTKCCSEVIYAAVDVGAGGGANRQKGKGEL